MRGLHLEHSERVPEVGGILGRYLLKICGTSLGGDRSRERAYFKFEASSEDSTYLKFD